MQVSTALYKRIVSAKVFIDENYHDAIDLDLISRQAFLSRFHFHRLFTRIYRKTPHQYLTQKKTGSCKNFIGQRRHQYHSCLQRHRF